MQDFGRKHIIDTIIQTSENKEQIKQNETKKDSNKQIISLFPFGKKKFIIFFSSPFFYKIKRQNNFFIKK